ncbi:MAG TPA: helix-turn-helix domain-containing protein [Spongiibacteraceae bacterium]|nr:helix-turn-helix domain-containing protein [Spongiibacteraceae bacterium]
MSTIDPQQKDTPRRNGTFNGIFGRLLRFWRTTLNISQEQLSAQVGVSVRHISFLENGRARPGRAMVLDLAQALSMGERDTNNFLLAAGFIPVYRAPQLQAAEMRWLRSSLVLTLRGLEPFPAVVHEPGGNIVMANRAWVQWLRELGESEMTPTNGNLYRWFFANTYVADADWETVACGLLMNLQQEAILSDTPEINALLAELEVLPTVPADWRSKAVKVAYFHSFRVVRIEHGRQRSYTSVTHTVGATPYVEQPRLLVNVLYPSDSATAMDGTADTLQSPLLFY